MLYRSSEVTCVHLAADMFRKSSLVLQFKEAVERRVLRGNLEKLIVGKFCSDLV